MYIPLTKEFLERQKLYEAYLVEGHLENAPAEVEEAFKKTRTGLTVNFMIKIPAFGWWLFHTCKAHCPLRRRVIFIPIFR